MAANTKIVVTAEDKASAALRRVGDAVGGIESAVGSVNRLTGLLGLFSGTAFAGVAAAIGNVTRELDGLDEAAQNAGVGAIALSEMRYAASFAGVEATQLDTAIGKLSIKIADAAKGGKQSADVFRSMGISVRDANGQVRSTEDVLADVADKFAGYADNARKTGLAAELLGDKAGPRLVAYLSQGRDGIREFTGVTEDAIRASVPFQDELNRLNQEWDKIKIGIARDVVPALNELMTRWRLAGEAGLGFFDTLALSAQTSGTDLDDPRAKLEQLRAQLLELQKAQQDTGLLSWWDDWEIARKASAAQAEIDLNKQIRFFEKLRASHKQLTAEEEAARAQYGWGDRGAPPAQQAPGVSEDGKTGKSSKTQADIDSLIKSLQSQLDKQYELTEAEKLLRDIQAGRYKDATAASVARAGQLANEVDAAAALAQFDKDTAQFLRERAQQEEELQRTHQRRIDEATAAYERGLSSLENYAAEIERLTKLYNEGAFGNGVEAARRFNVAIEGAQKGLDQLQSDVSEFAKEAQRNIQDALGETIKRTFKGDTDDILSMWIDMLLEMEAQAMAADIAKWIFGGTGNGGSGSVLFSLFSGAFGGGKASGGAVSPSQYYVVGEQGPEIFVPDSAGTIVPNGRTGGVSVVIHQTIHAGSNVSRAEVYEAAAMAARQAQIQMTESIRRGS